jgi:hypothetical protein
LTFWDSYDFSGGSSGIPLEQGQIVISTNSSATAAQLEASPVLSDFSGGAAQDWTEETLDLTPYVGQTIQVVWWYEGVSIGDPVYGWLVDDIAITGTAAGQGGTINISVNLSQGSFQLTGPLNRSGTGPLTLTNAPLGSYAIQFGDVAFYQTPTNQSGLLRNSAVSLNFNGNYTFLDLNHNGISDAWEKYYFAAVVTNRTQLTDSDGDGMSDYAEFLAGTNPTNSASNLKLLSSNYQTNGAVTVEWSAIPGRSYQVESSSDLTTWNPISGWNQAVNSPGTYTTTNPISGTVFFRVQVRP